MKKIIVISLFLFSCGQSQDEIEKKKEDLRKHKDGEIVYLKPDSSRCVITGLYWTSKFFDKVEIMYTGVMNNQVEINFKEEQIY